MGKSSKARRTIYKISVGLHSAGHIQAQAESPTGKDSFKAGYSTQPQGTQPRGNHVYAISRLRINRDDGKGETKFLPYVCLHIFSPIKMPSSPQKLSFRKYYNRIRGTGRGNMIIMYSSCHCHTFFLHCYVRDAYTKMLLINSTHSLSWLWICFWQPRGDITRALLQTNTMLWKFQMCMSQATVAKEFCLKGTNDGSLRISLIMTSVHRVMVSSFSSASGSLWASQGHGHPLFFFLSNVLAHCWDCRMYSEGVC